MNLLETTTKISNEDLIFEAKIAGEIPKLIQRILRRQVISRYIKEVGIDLTPVELQTAADRFRLRNELESTKATNQWLGANYLLIDDFEYLITQSLLADKLAQHLFGARVSEFFYQNTLDYHSATIYEVILQDRNLAIELFYSIQEGDLCFSDVAYQYATDPELRLRGGYLGKIGRKQLRPEISAAVFAAKPPQLIKPIATAVGVHLIRVEEISQPQLDEQLHQQILAELFDRWIAETIAELSSKISFA